MMIQIIFIGIVIFINQINAQYYNNCFNFKPTFVLTFYINNITIYVKTSAIQYTNSEVYNLNQIQCKYNYSNDSHKKAIYNYKL